jgi:enoyl-CoA hydratase/carnithine racemase
MTAVQVTRRADAVAVVTFDNPPVNALSSAMFDELVGLVAGLAKDEDVRAVVFTARGTKAFLSGADITELPARMADPAAMAAHSARVRVVFDAVAALPQPTVAAVQAAAMGGGLEFALLTDLLVCGAGVVFGLPEVRLGLIPGAGGTQRLLRRIPRQKAAEMVLTGATITAPEALTLGLVNQVVPGGEDVAAAGVALAARLAALPRVAVQAAKKAIAEGSGLALPDGLAIETAAFAAAAASADAQEGTRAFLGRRAPTFTHR